MISHIKILLLNHLPKILPHWLLAHYWILLSLGRWVIYGGHRIVSIKRINHTGGQIRKQQLILVRMSDGEVYIQGMTRVSRFLGGKARAEQRLLEIYLDARQIRLLQNLSEVVIVDVGANIGEFSLGFLKLFPMATLIAVEPDPIAHECLVRNLSERNGNGKIFIYNLALSDSTGQADFFVSTEEADSSLVQPIGETEIIKVRTCTLDTLLLESGIGEVAILKMDAEGHEPEVLYGALKSINQIVTLSIDVGAERRGSETALQVSNLLNVLKLENYVSLENGSRLILRGFNNYAK